MPHSLFLQIGSQFEAEYSTTVGQMFGKPCLKIDGKAFAAFFQEQMVFKLGKEHITDFKAIYSGSVNWDPSGKGRPMKDWLQVPNEFKADWEKLAFQAKLLVAEMR